MFSHKRLIGAPVAAAVAAAVLCTGAAVANAQTLQIDDPSFVSLGAGVFDVFHEEPAGEFRGEFRSNYKLLGFLKPLVGLMATTDRAVYGYGGFGVDLYFGPRWVLTPSAAVGAYDEGQGKKLGSVFEFRTGAELAYRFDDRSRLGLALHHISNAGITERNPGTETLMLIFSIPLTLLR